MPARNCGANFISPPKDESGADEGVTIVEGHEYAESVTDPNPPSGWYNNSYGEIGDICAWTERSERSLRKEVLLGAAGCSATPASLAFTPIRNDLTSYGSNHRLKPKEKGPLDYRAALVFSTVIAGGRSNV